MTDANRFPPKIEEISHNLFFDRRTESHDTKELNFPLF